MNMKFKKTSHYVYKITNIKNGMKYIGSRSCDIDPKRDLGNLYFSSSADQDFMKEQYDHPDIFEYEVLEMYDTQEDALKSEMLLLKSLNARSNPDYYNGNGYNNSSEKLTYGTDDIVDEILKRIGQEIKSTRKRRKITEMELAKHNGLSRATIQKIENGNKGVLIGSYIKCCYSLDIPTVVPADITRLKSIIEDLGLYFDKNIQ